MGDQSTQQRPTVEERYLEMIRDSPSYLRLKPRADAGDPWAKQLLQVLLTYPGDDDCC